MRPALAAADDGDAADRALLDRIATGDAAAFEAFYRRHHRRLFRFLARVTGDAGRVEEALNDSMLAIWQGADRFGGQSRVLTWLFGIAWRQARKAERRDRHWQDREDVDAVEIADPHCFETAWHDAEQAARLEAGFATLSPAQRAVVELTYFSGCDQAEIAAILDCPIGTVKTRMFHARERLRALFGTDGDRKGGG